MKKVIFVTSKKDDGNMSPKSESFQDNLEKFVASQNISMHPYVAMNQTHSSNVFFYSATKKNKKIPNCDSVITKSNVTLSIFTADCLPLVFFDEKNELIAAVHAGYKGILNGIIENTVKKLLEQGADISNLHLAVGPSIGVCCYDIKSDRTEEFYQKFGDLKGALEIRSRKHYLSLPKIVQKESMRLGILEKNITIQDICTKCSGLYYSYRSDNKIYGATEVLGLNITLARLQ